jgi:apolipoprotein N-acyltransferase
MMNVTDPHSAFCILTSSLRRCMMPFAVASGVLTACCFLHPSLSPLLLVALVPLLVAAARVSLGRAFALGWVMGAVGHAIAFSWILATIARFEHISATAAFPFFGALVAYYALQFALFAVGISWQARGAVRPSHDDQPAAVDLSLSTCMFAAAWWTTLEWAFPKIIPWSLSDPLAAAPVLRQAADLGGVHGLSFLVVLVNGAVAAAMVRRDLPQWRRLRPVATAAALMSAVLVYGAVRIRQFDFAPFGTSTTHPSTSSGQAEHQHSLSITIVQGGLRSGRDDLVQANEEAWATYRRLTEAALRREDAPASWHPHPRPLPRGEDAWEREKAADSSLTTEDSALNTDLIVWPETVLRVYLRQDGVYRARAVDLVRRLHVPLFLGSLDLPADRPGELNSGYLVEDDLAAGQDPAVRVRHSADIEVYHKRVLLPFGEYVPGASWLPLLRRWRTTGRFVGAESFHPLTLSRKEREPMDQPGNSVSSDDEHDSRTRLTTSFAPSICFEAIWPGAYNQLVRAGAEFLVNITDDGWFGDTAGPYEHLNAARLRAVETRRWLVRASNSGVSAFVDPTGTLVDSLPFGAVGTIRRRIAPAQSLTPYVRYGDWPVVLSLLIVFVISLARLIIIMRHG